MSGEYVEKRGLTWKVQTAKLLKEIVDCGIPQTMGVMYAPMNIFRTKLIELAELAKEINDPRLSLWCCEMTLFEQANPDSKDYDKNIFDKLQKEINKMEAENDN